MLIVKEQKIDQYIVNIAFADNIYGFFCRNKAFVKELLLLIAGINKSNATCLYNDEKCYDNKDYFKTRLYLDFENEYFETLNIEKIRLAVTEKYHLNLNYEELQRHIKTLNIRGECIITSRYAFTNVGNNLLNFAFALSTEENLIINNPTWAIDSGVDLEYIYTELRKKQRMVIFGIDHLQKMRFCLDKLIIFSDFNEVLILDITEKLYVLENTYNLPYQKVFIDKNNLHIIYRGLGKEELKNCDRLRIKYKVISPYDLEEYI